MKAAWVFLLCLVAAQVWPTVLWPHPAYAQSTDVAPTLLISDISGEAFPAVTLRIRPVPMTANALNLDDIKLIEEGVAVARNQITLQRGDDQSIGLVLAIDVSMPAAEFDRLRQSLKTLLTRLQPNDKISVLTFNEKINTPISAIRLSSIDKVQTALEALTAGGSFTALNAAIAAGVKEGQQLKTAPGHRALLVFTDSGENTNTQNPDDIAQAARQAHLPVYLFGFSLGKTRAIGSDIPVQTGGQSYISNGIDEALTNLPSVIDGLRQTYALRYQSALKADGQRHALRVEWQPGAAIPAEQAFVAKQGKVQVAIVGLPKSQWLGGDVQLGVDAQASSPIKQVDFMLDWQSIGSATHPPFQINWDTRSLQPGEHTLAVRVMDQAGNVGSSETKVQAPPMTQVQLNLSSSWIWAGNTVQAQADVNSVVPISRVELLIDGHVIDVYNKAPFVFDIPTRYVQGGKRVFSIQAQDALGRISVAQAELDVVGVPWRYIVSPIMAVLSVLLGCSLLAQMFSAWRTSQIRTYPLQVQNTGNAPSRYLLRIAGQRNPQALQLRLTHNGAALPLARVALANSDMPIEFNEDDPDSVTATHKVDPDLNTVRTQGGAAVAKGKAALAGANAQVAKVGKMAAIASETLMMLGSWLPGSAGVKFKEFGARIQQAQFATKRATSTVTKVQNVAQSTIDNTAEIAATATGKAGKISAASAAVANVSGAAPTVRQSRGSAAVEGVVVAEPTVGTEITSAVAAHARVGRTGRWSITPLIAPGDALTLGLVAQPKRPQLNRSLLYTLELESRSAEDSNGIDGHSSNFSLDMRASNGWTRYQPFVLAFAIGASMLVVAGWFLWIGGLLR